MIGETMVYVASVVIVLWGAAHIAPTKPVVSGFGTLSRENRSIITMEWVSEGLTLIFVGALCFLMTLVVGSNTAGTVFVYRACAVMLLAMATWTSVTAGRTSIVQFKICPIVKLGTAILLLVGSAV